MFTVCISGKKRKPRHDEDRRRMQRRDSKNQRQEGGLHQRFRHREGIGRPRRRRDRPVVQQVEPLKKLST